MTKSTIGRIFRSLAGRLSVASPSLAAWLLDALFTRPLRFSRPAREQAWMADATQRFTFTPDGRRLPVYSWGQGPAVLLVHGWAGRGSQMAAFAAPLVHAGYRVVTFDAPAHGGAQGRRTAVPDFAVAIASVAAAEGPFEAVIAHSLGTAATSLAMARGLEVRRAVYLAPPEDLIGFLERTAGALGFTPDIVHGASRLLERRYGIRIDDVRGRAVAPAQTAELLAFHSTDDAEIPYSEAVRLTELWPHAELVTLEDLGHVRLLRDAAVIDRAVRFLARPAARRQGRLTLAEGDVARMPVHGVPTAA